MYDYYSSYGTYSYPSYSNSYGSEVLAGSAAGAIFATVMTIFAATWFVSLVLMILRYVGSWKMFKKANLDGWEALVPGHNVFVEFHGVKPESFRGMQSTKAYGKSTGFGIGLFLLGSIFRPILGLGNATYVGPQSDNNVNSNNVVNNNSSENN